MRNLFTRIPLEKKHQGLFLVSDEKYPKILDSCILWDADGKTKLFARLEELEKQGIAAYIEDQEGNRVS